MASDRELLQEAKDHLKKQNDLLESLGEEALLLGSVIAKTADNKLIVTAGGDPLVVNSLGGAVPGDTVWLLGSTKQILKKGPPLGLGQLVDVRAVHDSGVEIEVNGRVMLASPGQTKPNKGDRVMLDASGTIVLAIIVKNDKPEFVPTVTPVQWDDIGGHREAKLRIIEAIELPYKHPALYAKYKKKPPSGILLYGPPGCGKTLLGKAIATAIGSTGGFISVKGPELLDPYVGVAEANVRALFRHATEWKVKSGKPGVIFIDEADALLAARGRAHNYMGQTIVPMFLTEMQGLEESSALVILATNRPDILDPAVLRDGRIDAKIEIPRPDKGDAQEILAIHIDNKPIMKECGNRKLMSEIVADVLYDGAPDLSYSGALLEGLVAKASDYAIRRDLKTRCKEPSGLSIEDFKSATVDVLDQERLTASSGG